MKKVLLLIITWYLFLQNCFSQNKRDIDILKREISTAKEDSIKIKAAYELSSLYQDVKIDSSFYYATICKGLLKGSSNTKFEIKLMVLLSQLYSSLGRDDHTLEYLLNALNIAAKNNLYQEVATISNYIANFYQQKNFLKVVEYHSKALNAAKKSKNNELINDILNSGSNYYFNVGDYDKAKNIMDEQIKLNPLLKDAMLSDYGDLYRVKKDFKVAQEYYLKAIKIFEDRKDTFQLIFLYHNFALIPLMQKQYNKAIHYKNISKEFAISLNAIDFLAKINSELAVLYADLGDYRSALKFNLEAIQFYRNRGEVNVLKELIKFNSEINFKLGNTAEAYKELNTFIEMQNAQNSKEIQSKISMLESSILLDKKQNEINLLNKDREIQRKDLEKQKTRVVLTIVGLILVLIFTFFVLRLLRIRNRQNKVIAEQKAQSDALLLNILPFEVAKELMETGTAKAKRYETVTVLFTDFKNFTAISEKLSPEELVKEINYCYSEFDKIITKYGIEKIKTIGDSYMCAGGLPTKNETNPWDVVSAGIELQKFIIKHKEECIRHDLPYFELRLGIHTGVVVAGIVGVKKFAYDIWGDTVNIASRMESSGEVGKVNISGSTYEIVKNKFNCVHRGKILAKNKGEIDMYFVEGKA